MRARVRFNARHVEPKQPREKLPYDGRRREGKETAGNSKNVRRGGWALWVKDVEGFLGDADKEGLIRVQ